MYKLRKSHLLAWLPFLLLALLGIFIFVWIFTQKVFDCGNLADKGKEKKSRKS